MADVNPMLRGYKYLFNVSTASRPDTNRYSYKGVAGGFNKVSGISEEIEVIDKRDGTDPFQIRRIKGTHQGGTVQLERGVIQDKRDFLNWFQAVKDGRVPYWTDFFVSLNDVTDPQQNISPPLESYRFFNGWPSRYELGELNANESGLAVERLSLVHDGMRYQFSQQPGAAERRERSERRTLRPVR